MLGAQKKGHPTVAFFIPVTCESNRTHVRITCDSNDIQRQFPALCPSAPEGVLIGVDRLLWWSWGDLNPRPQAFFGQIYMFSGLI